MEIYTSKKMALLNNEGSFSCQIEWHCWSSTFIHCIIIIWSHSCYNEPAEYLIEGTMNEFAIYGECRVSIPLCLTSLLLSAFFSVCWTQDQTRKKTIGYPYSSQFISYFVLLNSFFYVWTTVKHPEIEGGLTMFGSNEMIVTAFATYIVRFGS